MKLEGRIPDWGAPQRAAPTKAHLGIFTGSLMLLLIYRHAAFAAQAATPPRSPRPRPSLPYRKEGYLATGATQSGASFPRASCARVTRGDAEAKHVHTLAGLTSPRGGTRRA